jgi:hypothetical protein
MFLRKNRASVSLKTILNLLPRPAMDSQGATQVLSLGLPAFRIGFTPSSSSASSGLTLPYPMEPITLGYIYAGIRSLSFHSAFLALIDYSGFSSNILGRRGLTGSEGGGGR